MERRVSVVKPRVLVLDDDLLALELYSRELGGDYQVTTSESVDETRCYLKDGSLDALIIEPAINDGEGWVLLSEIQSFPNPPWWFYAVSKTNGKMGWNREHWLLW